MTEPIDVDNLPPTQYLILEALTARHRLGEALWTFPSGPAYRKAADELAKQGLVGWKSGPAPKTIQVWFTDLGKERCCSHAYTPPILQQQQSVPPLDLRALAVILNAGRDGAEKMQDAGLAHTLSFMTEQVVALCEGPTNIIGSLDEEFAKVKDRYQ